MIKQEWQRVQLDNGQLRFIGYCLGKYTYLTIFELLFMLATSPLGLARLGTATRHDGLKVAANLQGSTWLLFSSKQLQGLSSYHRLGMFWLGSSRS
jgi:hypothetical protein